MKNELLNYVQEMSEKNNTSTKLEIKPDTEKVEGSNFYNKLSVADFGDNVYELDRFSKNVKLVIANLPHQQKKCQKKCLLKNQVPLIVKAMKVYIYLKQMMKKFNKVL